MNQITKGSLAIIILSSTLLFTGANQAGEAKIDTLKPLTITESLMSEMKFKIVKIPPMEINPHEIEPLITEAKVEIDNYRIFNVSAYTNHEHSTGKTSKSKTYGITASGSHTAQGRTIAADWRVLPKGTTVYIEGVGERVVEDKGGAIKGNKIDVYFQNEQDALRFGRKQLNVKIIKVGD